MTTCRYGLWPNTIPTSISMTCGRGPRSRCRKSSASIVSNAARLRKFLQGRASLMGRREIDDGLIDASKIEHEFAAACQSLQHCNIEPEIPRLAPRGDGSIRPTADIRRIDRRQHHWTVVQKQRPRTSQAEVADLPVVAGRNVNPEPVGNLTALIPLHRPEIRKARSLAVTQRRVLDGLHEFDGLLQSTHCYAGPLVENFRRFDGGLAGATDQKPDDQHGLNQRQTHGLIIQGS